VCRYGDQSYNAATWRKVVVVSQIVGWGFNVLHSDVDVVSGGFGYPASAML
jgi:hypothetical protein